MSGCGGLCKPTGQTEWPQATQKPQESHLRTPEAIEGKEWLASPRFSKGGGHREPPETHHFQVWVPRKPIMHFSRGCSLCRRLD